VRPVVGPPNIQGLGLERYRLSDARAVLRPRSVRIGRAVYGNFRAWRNKAYGTKPTSLAHVAAGLGQPPNSIGRRAVEFAQRSSARNLGDRTAIAPCPATTGLSASARIRPTGHFCSLALRPDCVECAGCTSLRHPQQLLGVIALTAVSPHHPAVIGRDQLPHLLRFLIAMPKTNLIHCRGRRIEGHHKGFDPVDAEARILLESTMCSDPGPTGGLSVFGTHLRKSRFH